MTAEILSLTAAYFFHGGGINLILAVKFITFQYEARRMSLVRCN